VKPTAKKGDLPIEFKDKYEQVPYFDCKCLICKKQEKVVY